MQEALESIFGPGVGLIGFVVMAIIILPKFLVRWRGFRARQKGPVDCRPRQTGLRAIHIEPFPEAESYEAHPDHGRTMAVFSANRLVILLETIGWLLPLLAVIIFVPSGHQSLRVISLCAAIPIACIGLFSLSHLGDKLIFYQTGAVFRIKFGKSSIDYNSIYSMTERKSMIPGLASTYILHMDDEKLIALDGSILKQGHSLKPLFRSLDARVRSSASEETFREM